MLKFDGKEFRNLEEQVQKNKADIENVLQTSAVLGKLGIKVVGQVSEENDLPDPLTYEGEYGDAYSVGTETPYDFYIYTRANDETPQSHWFDIGKFPVAGPTGATGAKGDTGTRGSVIVFRTSAPSSVSGYMKGDLYVNSTNMALYYYDSGWNFQGYLKGDKGDKGDTGATGSRGPAGQTTNILGILSATELLPDPSTVDKNTGYLVGASGSYTLYIIVGDESSPSSWQWVSTPVAGGSQVTIDGSIVATFDADTKVDKTEFTEYIEKTYSKTVLNVSILSTDWDDNNSVTLENSLYTASNLIYLTARADNSEILGNTKNVASAQITPTEITTAGSLVLTCESVPSSTLYLTIVIETEQEVA